MEQWQKFINLYRNIIVEDDATVIVTCVSFDRVGNVYSDRITKGTDGTYTIKTIYDRTKEQISTRKYSNIGQYLIG